MVCLPSTDQSRTYYCTKECQTKDWTNHKHVCKTLRNEIEYQSLTNATQFLSNIFYLLRIESFDLSIKSMKLEGTTLVVCEGQYEDDGRVVDAPFEIMDVSSGSINRMLLSMMACDDTLGHMHYLIHMILLGKSKEMHTYHD